MSTKAVKMSPSAKPNGQNSKIVRAEAWKKAFARAQSLTTWKKAQALPWLTIFQGIFLASSIYHIARYAPHFQTDIKVLSFIDLKKPAWTTLRSVQGDLRDLIESKTRLSERSVFAAYVIPLMSLASHSAYTFLRSKTSVKFLRYCYSANFVNAVTGYATICFSNESVQRRMIKSRDFFFAGSGVLYLIAGRVLVVSLMVSCLLLELMCIIYTKRAQKRHLD